MPISALLSQVCSEIPKKVQKMETFRGQVVHKRSISKKLMFVDVMKLKPLDCTQSAEPHSHNGYNEAPAGQSRISVILKSVICGNEVIEMARKSPSKIHIGDEVEFRGEFEREDMASFLAYSYKIETKWTETSLGKSFDPIPPLPRYYKKRCIDQLVYN